MTRTLAAGFTARGRVIQLARQTGRGLLPVAGPALLLAVAYPLARQVESASWEVRALAAHAPWAVFALGLFLAAWFHRSRAVFALLALAAAYWVCTALVPGGPGRGAHGQVAYAAAAVLLPVNLAAFALYRERGLVSERGMARLVALAVQALAVGAATAAPAWLDPGSAAALQEAAAALLHARVFDPAFDAWTYLPQPAILLFAGLFVLLALRAASARGAPMETGLMAAALAGALALHMVGRGYAAPAFFGVAAAVLVVAVVQDSYRMAFLDELTGLPARRALMAQLMRLGERYTIAMLDVDHFKKFNDTYGHDVGDQVLRLVATRMAEVGGGGRSFRYGGEEFTVVFPNKDKEAAYPHLEALRKAVAASTFTLRGPDRPDEKPDPVPNAAGPRRTVSVTISIGVAEPDRLRPTPKDVLKLADEALYRAKDGGRNRVSA